MTTPPQSMVAAMAAAMQAESINKPFRWENAARAALTAMLDPSPGMIDAAIAALVRLDSSGEIETPKLPRDRYRQAVADSWRAQITAALNEGEG